MPPDETLQKELALTAKLLPCPFCGSDAWLSLDWSPTTYQIECKSNSEAVKDTGCHAFMFRNHTISGFDQDIAALMTRWNRRA